MKHKFISFCIALAISIAGFTQNIPSNAILWDSNSALKWDNFKGSSSNLEGNQAASVMSGISMTVDFNKDYTQGIVKVIAYMDPKKSAKRKSCDGEYLLKHEQLHFDITEWYARKIRKEIAELRVPMNKLSKECTKIFTRLNRELNDQQRAYDRMTNHSINKLEQENWNRKVAKGLEELIGNKEALIIVEYR